MTDNTSDDELFFHVASNEEKCKDGQPHNWEGNRDILDSEGNICGGTTICTKCGLDAFSHSLRYGI